MSVDRLEPAVLLVMPEGPAVASREALHERAHLVNGADDVVDGDCSVCPHDGSVSPFVVGENRPRGDQTGFDQGRERNARFAPLGREFGDGIVVSAEETANGSDQQVTVAFKGAAGVKKLLLSFAPLERLAV